MLCKTDISAFPCDEEVGGKHLCSLFCSILCKFGEACFGSTRISDGLYMGNGVIIGDIGSGEYSHGYGTGNRVAGRQARCILRLKDNQGHFFIPLH